MIVIGAGNAATLAEVEPMSEKNQFAHATAGSDLELEQSILLLQGPFGDGPHQREYLQAVQYLLDHAAQAHSRLLGLLQSERATNPYAVIEILPRFGLQESVPILAELMARGPTNLCQASAQALAVHPLDDAREALIRGLSLARKDVVIAAADGLMSRGDAMACPALKKLLTHPDPDLRYHVIQAAGSLSCLKRVTLSAIARDDQSDEIRELAKQFIQIATNPGDKH